MAAELSVRDKSGSLLVDILDGTFRVVSWSTRYADDRAFDVIGLRTRGSDATIRSAVDAMGDALDNIFKYNEDDLLPDSIWLEAYSDGETAKRGFLYSAELVERQQQFLIPQLLGKEAANYALLTERGRSWEDKTPASTFQSTNVNVLGGKYVLTDKGGNVDGRIEEFRIKSNSGTVGPKFWVGIRPTYQGTANFDPQWECEDGASDQDCSNETDADAVGNDALRTTFTAGSGSLRRKWAGSVASYVPTNPNHMVGEYLFLARMRMENASTTMGVYLRDGYTGGTTEVSREQIFVTGTDYALYEMGIVKIPPIGFRDPWDISQSARNVQFNLHAELIEGTPGTDYGWFDCVIFIPTKHMFFSQGDNSLTPLFTNYLSIYTTDNLENLAQMWLYQTPPGTIVPTGNPTEGPTNWYYPVGGGVAVVAVDEVNDPDNDDVDLIFQRLFPRWRNVRG